MEQRMPLLHPLSAHVDGAIPLWVYSIDPFGKRNQIYFHLANKPGRRVNLAFSCFVYLTFLRGIQVTDGSGAVNFHTVFPGFYMGRTNHIHFKVRVGGQVKGNSYEAGHASHVGQIFFPEELAAQLMEHEPCSRHKIHRTTQAEDAIYNDQHGDASVARVSRFQPGDSAAGFRAELIAAVNPDAVPTAAERRRRPGGPSGPPPNR